MAYEINRWLSAATTVLDSKGEKPIFRLLVSTETGKPITVELQENETHEVLDRWVVPVGAAYEIGSILMAASMQKSNEAQEQMQRGEGGL